jgi:tight adherence protein B
MALLVGIITFIIVTAILALVWMFSAVDKDQEVIRRRIEAVRKAEKRGNHAIDLKLVRDDLLSGIPVLNRFLLRWSWSTRFHTYLVQAGLKIKPAKIILISGIVAVLSYFMAASYNLRFPIPAVAGLAFGTIPFGIVAWKRNRRLRRFEEHFPEALDLLGRAVRAGHAFTTGLEMIAKESPEPIAGEFRAAFEEQNFGLPLRDAMLNLADRVPLVDVRFFITALLIQKETGGNLAEILDGLARVIRDRFRIYRDVKTRTAQGRLTALILISLPPIMFLTLRVVNHDYVQVLFDDPLGPTILAITLGMQIVGSVLLWKIIHIKV